METVDLHQHRRGRMFPLRLRGKPTFGPDGEGVCVFEGDLGDRMAGAVGDGASRAPGTAQLAPSQAVHQGVAEADGCRLVQQTDGDGAPAEASDCVM